MVPHFTDAIQNSILAAGSGSDIHIVEIGGTVGDIEGLAFIEAIRELSGKLGRHNCIFAHVVYIPYLGTSKEFKTKPAQNAVRELRSLGIVPDLLLARTEQQVGDHIIDKLSMFGGVPREAVVLLPNAHTVYEVPLTLQKYNIDNFVLNRFGLQAHEADMSRWHDIVLAASTKREQTVRIGIVAKYLDNEDTYFSVIEALRSAAWNQEVNLRYDWVDAQQLEREGTESLAQYDGLLVPGGFGARGVEGKIAAARFAMDHNMPYFGICLGLQVAAIAAARKAGVEGANTSEVDPNTPNPVIYIMDDQQGKESTGGTMRLGDYPCVTTEGSLAEHVYGSREIVERHRHRYEVNQRQYRDLLESAGLRLSGLSPDGRLVEMLEYPANDYFVATQAHPEFRSRPNRAHPLFDGLIAAAKVRQQR
jgi:CTP synthase